MFLILGDVHGDFDLLNRFIDRIVRKNRMLSGMAECYSEWGGDYRVIILQCGDFGYYWPWNKSTGQIRNGIDWLPGGRLPIYWCGGNHEDWDALDRLGTEISEIDEGVLFCPFGSTFRVKDDLAILFAGGADSIDKRFRLEEMRKGAPKIWWEQEGVSGADLERLASVPKADWIVSHTAPAVFDLSGKMETVFAEPSRKMLDMVFERYHPSRWFFGHFHRFMKGGTAGCRWEGLADLRSFERYWDRAWIEWED